MTGGILEPICKDCAVYFSIIIMIINLHLPLLLDSTDVDVEKDADVEKAPPPPKRNFLYTFFVVAFVTQTLLRGNVARVFSRLCGIALPAKSPALLKLSWQLAKDLVDPTDPGSFNQALILHRISLRSFFLVGLKVVWRDVHWWAGPTRFGLVWCKRIGSKS